MGGGGQGSWLGGYADVAVGLQAGEDGGWLKENVARFEERAAAGDGDFRDLLEEMRTRGDLREVVS